MNLITNKEKSRTLMNIRDLYSPILIRENPLNPWTLLLCLSVNSVPLCDHFGLSQKSNLQEKLASSN